MGLQPYGTRLAEASTARGWCPRLPWRAAHTAPGMELREGHCRPAVCSPRILLRLLLLSFGVRASYACTSCSCSTTDAALQSKVSQWISNRATAQTQHGHISTWDVSRVTDMSCLFCSSCNGFREAFNDDISAWDVSRVISMHVRALQLPHRSATS